ncbi:hypothetical protein [Chishuiella sp.]|uniref:hypothetical protein n=1 Tax=Chishuiella sp. TaxID=1969467 RepID=UPI0028B04613|nr:hypothetical protein [Chishuiella sp.]
MKKIINIIFFIGFLSISYSQILISDDNSLTKVNEDAILELKTVNNYKGLLLPYVNLNSTVLSSPLPSHIIGMIVYNLNTSINEDVNTSVFPGIYHNNGVNWEKIEFESPSFGDIKYSAISKDHDGWYLLDGRLLTSLSISSSKKATELGFINNLPDTKDKFLKNKSSIENIGQSVGSNSAVLIQANLPNITLNGTTNSFTHSHTYNERGTGVINSIDGGNNRVIADNNNTNRITGAAGGHTHSYTVNSGGNNTPITIEPKYLEAYIFVYLGN